MVTEPVKGNMYCKLSYLICLWCLPTFLRVHSDEDCAHAFVASASRHLHALATTSWVEQAAMPFTNSHVRLCGTSTCLIGLADARGRDIERGLECMEAILYTYKTPLLGFAVKQCDLSLPGRAITP